MTWSLLIANGDLSFNGASMDIVQGGDKLVQDLACCILEPMGTDGLHPTFGSTIGGGINADGSYNAGVIGQPNDAVAATYVQGEVTRIVAQYQAQQQQRFQADVAVYGKGTITADEALLSVGGISAVGAQTTLQVSAQLETGTGNVPISLPISSS
jgi:hypothetical protein